MSSAVHKDGRDTCDYTEMRENIKHYKEKIDEKCLCKFCGKLCISREKLGRHIRSVHKLVQIKVLISGTIGWHFFVNILTF